MRTLFAATAIALLPALPAAAQDMRPPHILPDGTLLEIAAEGKSTRVPDVAVIRAGVVTQAPTAAAALRENARRMTAVTAALRSAGVAERDIQTARISLDPQQRFEDGKPPVITGYQATNQVTIRFRDVAKSGAILDALVAQGANSIEGPNFMIDAPDAALDEARTDAVAKARARAELYARSAGLRVDRILAISELAADIPPRPMPMAMRGMVADAASTPIAAGEQEVRVNLNVRFLLK